MTTLKTLRQLPSPKRHFLFGHLLQFKPLIKHKVLENWVRESGPLFRIRLLTKRFIVSADPDLNQKILKARPDTFRRYYKINEIMAEQGITGVFNAEGSVWEQHRKITADALSYKHVKAYYPLLTRVADRLLSRWKTFEESGQIIDVQKEMMRFTVDITTLIAFGYDTNTLEKEQDSIQKHLEKIFPMINKRMTAPLPLWRWMKSAKDKELDHALSELKQSIDLFISEAKKRMALHPELKEKPGNFLEALLVEQEKDQSFSDQDIFGNVFTMLLAGEDTTSNSIAWAMYYLCLHPAWVQKIREEANLHYPSEHLPASFDIIAKLKTAEAVAQEAMRLKPVTPTLFMQALKDVEIHPLLIRKGETVMLQNKVAQTDETHFGGADRFLPERWLMSGCPVHGGAHHPDVMRAFGAGPRFCPGKTLAMHELVLALSMICKNFTIELAVDAAQVEEIFSFTMAPSNLLVKLKQVVR